MRALLFLLLIICLSTAQNITYFLNLSMSSSCPGDILDVYAIASNGQPADDVEIRLVRYSPYQGLRALKHTNSQGYTFFELTNTGLYRLYISEAEAYEHPKYVEFNYSAMCPPPPAKTFDISVTPDCNSSRLGITITAAGKPLEGAYVSVLNYSSLTSTSGAVVFPLQEGPLLIKVSRKNYSSKQVTTYIDCAPPECTDDSSCKDDQYCYSGICFNITGTCGYAANHTWFQYGCCDDTDCDGNETCLDFLCYAPPPIINITNITNVSNITNMTNITGTNATGNATGAQEEEEALCPAAFFILIILLKISGLPG